MGIINNQDVGGSNLKPVNVGRVPRQAPGVGKTLEDLSLCL